MEAGGLEFFFKKYIDGAVVATSSSMIICRRKINGINFNAIFT